MKKDEEQEHEQNTKTLEKMMKTDYYHLLFAIIFYANITCSMRFGEHGTNTLTRERVEMKYSHLCGTHQNIQITIAHQ